MSTDADALVAVLRHLFRAPARPEQFGRELWLACWMVGMVRGAIEAIQHVALGYAKALERLPHEGADDLGEKIPPSGD